MEKRDRLFHQTNGGDILNCPSTDKVEGVVMCSESMFKSHNGVDSFYGSGWDPIVSLNQSGNLGNSSMVHMNEFTTNPHYSSVLENQTMGSSSHLVHFPSDSGLVDTMSKIPSFGSGSFSGMVSSFGHITNEIGVQREGINVTHPQQNSDEEVLGASPMGKRKRKVSLRNSPKNTEEEQKQDTCEDLSDVPKEDDEKKQNIGANSSSKQTVKQGNESTLSGEPSKENYIHVRAKRGQATNSHSLAERVRRERISERMRLLQELVPGCNKITGKAVMLDEIINYVQSLQQQVEFLSMKLATVNPDMNLDIERILSKDILHSQGSGGTAFGNSLGVSSAHPLPGYSQGTFNTCTTAPFHSLPQNLWNNIDLQNVLQMGFGSSPNVQNLGQNGLSQME